MTDKHDNEDRDLDTWITVGGKKIRIPAGEDSEKYLHENLPTIGGQKQSNTKQARKSVYKKRHGLFKSQFKLRDEVVFNEYTKSGVISSIDGSRLGILSNHNFYKTDKNSTFKKSELLDGIHWDTMTQKHRLSLCKSKGFSSLYATKNWENIDYRARDRILKAFPGGGIGTEANVHTPIYNPLNTEKTLTQRVEQEIKEQYNKETDEKEKSD